MKTARQDKILELIARYQIDTQEELAARLNEAGYKVTQATVSRDIRSLRLTKVAGEDGRSYYAVLPESVSRSQDKYMRVLTDAVTDAAVGQNLVVIRTGSGMAMGAATALDALDWPQLLGCIAGDDTVFCACRTHEEALEILARLEGLGVDRTGGR